jgi:hypothetical protein
MGVPGVVEPDTGIVSIAPALKWKDFQLKADWSSVSRFPS